MCLLRAVVAVYPVIAEAEFPEEVEPICGRVINIKGVLVSTRHKNNIDLADTLFSHHFAISGGHNKYISHVVTRSLFHSNNLPLK